MYVVGLICNWLVSISLPQSLITFPILRTYARFMRINGATYYYLPIPSISTSFIASPCKTQYVRARTQEVWRSTKLVYLQTLWSIVLITAALPMNGYWQIRKHCTSIEFRRWVNISVLGLAGFCSHWREMPRCEGEIRCSKPSHIGRWKT